MLNIYVISQWYRPEPDGRVSTLAEELAKAGHEVTVITGVPNYPVGKIYDGYKIKLYQREKLNNVNVIRLPLYPNHSESVGKRMLNYISFSLSLFFIAPWFIKKPDVFWVYTPFVVMPAIFYRFLFKSPYVLEITDIWPDTLSASAIVKKGMLVNLLNLIAKAGYKYADAITLQNLGFKSCLESRGAAKSKLHVIENWADESVFYPASYDVDLAIKHSMRGKFNVVFAGNLGMAQGLDTIIDTAGLCCRDSGIQFVFIGDGVCLKHLKRRVLHENLYNVIFIVRQPLNDMAAFFAISDVLLVSLRADPLFRITLPSKTQAYLACRKPLIIIKQGDDAKMLVKQGCAIQCEPGQPEQLAEAIGCIKEMEAKDREQMAESSLRLFKEKYRKDLLVRKMEDVIVSVASGSYAK